MREELIATLHENKVALYRVALSYVHTEAEALDIVQATAEKRCVRWVRCRSRAI